MTPEYEDEDIELIELEKRANFAKALAEGRAALNAQNYTEAAASFKRAIQIDAGQTSARDGLIDTLQQAGRDALLRQDFHAALVYFDDLTKIDEVKGRSGRSSVLYQQGELARKEGNFPRAKTLFEELGKLDPNNAQARSGLIETLYAQGQVAETKGKRKEAIGYYQALLDFAPGDINAQVRMTAITRQIRIRKTIMISVCVLIFLSLCISAYALTSDSVLKPQWACVEGNIICTLTPTLTPTFTPTYTPTHTPTYTPTSTHTPTPTYTPTNTPTFTPSPTPSPEPYLGIVNNSGLGRVYRDATGNDRVSVLNNGEQVYLCAQAGSRYLISNNHCHLTTPLGWVDMFMITHGFAGSFPSILTTPGVATHTPVPLISPTPTP